MNSFFPVSKVCPGDIRFWDLDGNDLIGLGNWTLSDHSELSIMEIKDPDIFMVLI